MLSDGGAFDNLGKNKELFISNFLKTRSVSLTSKKYSFHAISREGHLRCSHRGEFCIPHGPMVGYAPPYTTKIPNACPVPGGMGGGGRAWN